ncbi:hypothetical protein DEH80_03695 [Abyssibacter profundi]|uniref:Uncharacterized protein n=2 Tax=Abyssibacter profundi TaxID=2182787 RepID=A0A363UNQ2_9GAMM|nr:hypothetical protein DEH80_03695 [Abyssibacter profundi]
MAMSLLDSALRRVQVRKAGEVTLIVFDGLGAVATDTLGFRSAERWAFSRISSGNVVRDRTTFLERLETAIVRRGTSVTTTHGTSRGVAGLAKKMKQAGYNLSEWQLTQAAKDILDPPPETDADMDADEEPADEGHPDDPTPIEVSPRRDTVDRSGIDHSLDD